MQGVSKVAAQLMSQHSATGSDISAVDIYEGNIGAGDTNGLDARGGGKAARRKQMKRHSLPGFLDSSNSYQVRNFITFFKYDHSFCYLNLAYNLTKQHADLNPDFII